MKAAFSSPTETWHCTSYEAISPTRPELSVANKTVIVTGGGRGLGADMARGFAAAGAAHVVLIGRTQSTLSQMADSIKKEFASVTMSTHAADVADEVSIGKVAEQVGKWDILILNAGIIGPKKSAEKSLVADWWSVFEVPSPSPYRLITFQFHCFLATYSCPSIVFHGLPKNSSGNV